MISDVAAKRYAEAAYLVAQEDGKPDEWLAGLKSMSALFSDPDADAFFHNSRVPLEQKRQLVERALEGIDVKVRNLALLLLRRGRTELGPQIAEAYQEILDEAKGISHALVTSAVELSQDEQEAVQRKLVDLAGGPVVVRTEVDESIIGGLVVRIGDRLIDGSTRSRLMELKKSLEGVRA